MGDALSLPNGQVSHIDLCCDHVPADCNETAAAAVEKGEYIEPVADFASATVSPYAATKKATELMAYTFNHLYNLPVAGLRFFTVYGPSGRPDMAPAKFLTRAATGVPIDQYGNGSSERDYTMSMTLSLVLCAHWTGRLLIPRCTTWGTGGPSRSSGSSHLWARPSRPPLRL